MLTLFIDESGQFENDQEYSRVVVGGLMVKHSTDQELMERNREMVQIFRESYGHNYQGSLHGRERNHAGQELYINKLNGNRDIQSFYIVNGSRSTKITSNIADDSMASLLYFNMLNQLLTGVLFFDPDILEDVDTVRIFLASRVAVESSMRGDRKESFKSLGYEGRTGKSGDLIYQLNNETSLLIHLNREFKEIGPILEIGGRGRTKGQLHLQIEKVSIQYQHNSFPYMEMFYAADIICNQVYKNLRNNRSHNLLLAQVFIYDDIHEQVRIMLERYRKRDWFGFIVENASFHTKYRNHTYKAKYDAYCSTMESSVHSEINGKEASDLLSRVQAMMSKGEYNRNQAMLVLSFVERLLNLLSPMDRIAYYDLLLQDNNHRGAYFEGIQAYEKAREEIENIKSVGAAERLLSMTLKLATTYANAFDFHAAITTIEGAIEMQLHLQEAYSLIQSIFINGDEDVKSSDIVLGKMYSSRGQFFAFQRKKEAYYDFRRALALLKGDPGNRAITLSYLTHYLAECEEPTSEYDRELVVEYLGTLDPNRFMPEYLLIEGIPDVAQSFRLYAFLKWLRYKGNYRTSTAILKKAANKALSYPIEMLQHPWELICMQLAELLHSDREISDKLYHKARMICSNRENHLTLRLIGALAQVRQYNDNASVNAFVNLVNDSGNPQLMRYFNLSKLSTLSTAHEKAKYIIRQFSFTVH